MPKPELNKMVTDAYSDPEILEYLYRNHMYHYDRVIKKILMEHFNRVNGGK
tara:strand:+ start:548 stop:700 length:153 start_codon:yes stop_codon:yes gene_type:complete